MCDTHDIDLWSNTTSWHSVRHFCLLHRQLLIAVSQYANSPLPNPRLADILGNA